MTANTPPPTPDNTTQILGLAAAFVAAIAAVINRLPTKKKRDTSEHLALKEVVKRDDTIADLRRQLDERETELMKAEKELNQLRPLGSEIETLRATNEGLTNYNKLLSQELADIHKRSDLS